MDVMPLANLLIDARLQRQLQRNIRDGSIVIYPTDTVYGIGCDATNNVAVRALRELKGSDQPFSVIVPSNHWITQHLQPIDKQFLSLLPGPVTLLVKKKNPLFLLDCAPTDALGIRIPAHPLTTILQQSDVPVVSTSANLHGHPTITGLARLPNQLKPDVFIDGGTLSSVASTVWDLTGKEPKKIR